MAITEWLVKELMTRVKMNNFGIRRASRAEQVAVLDVDRLIGDNYFGTDDKTMEIYQSGSGATFKRTQLSNFIFRSGVEVGIGAVEATIYDEEINNQDGVSNTRVLVFVDYIAEVSQAGSVKVTVTDGSSPVTVTDSFSSNPTPVRQFFKFVIDTSSFAIDDLLNILVLATQANVKNVEMRCV